MADVVKAVGGFDNGPCQWCAREEPCECGDGQCACTCGRCEHPFPLSDDGVAQPERHSEAYDPGPRRRIGGHYFDVDDVPPRGDRDY